MKVVLLLAGLGSRLRPYTDSVPKCLVRLEGKPLLEYQLEAMGKCGVKSEDITLITGYRSEALNGYELNTIVNKQYDSTNMVYSLFLALSDIENEDVVVAYGDIVYNYTVLQSLILSEEDMSVVVDLDWQNLWGMRLDNPLDDAETLKIRNEKIVEIGKKPSSLKDVEAQYIGLFKIGKSFLKDFKLQYKCLSSAYGSIEEFENMYMTDFLQEIASSYNNVCPVKIRGKWLEVDTCEDLNIYHNQKYLDTIIQDK